MRRATRWAAIAATAFSLAGVRAPAGPRCPHEAGKARTRTLAYVTTRCRTDAGGVGAIRQSLRIRRGDCPPATVLEFAAPPAPDPLHLCRLFGQSRFGLVSVSAGVFQRLAVSPDGSGVVFEVTNDLDIFPSAPLAEEQKGFFFVGADGRGMRRLGPASHDAAFRLVPAPGSELGVAPNPTGSVTFSPDGRRVVYTDRGPGPGGVDAIQVVTLDVVTGERTQVTHLPPATSTDPGNPDTAFPRFIDERTIAFLTYSNPDGAHPRLTSFTVRANGTRLRALPVPVAVAGSSVSPRFSVSGAGSKVLTLGVPGIAVNPVPGLPPIVFEVFFLDGRNLLQLTNYHRFDTSGQFLGLAGQAFFTASADPLGRNPSENCQLFSVNRLGARVRQLTRFREGPHSDFGCNSGSPPAGCTVGNVCQDLVTGAVVFYSSCDALGTTPFGAQMYAVRPDGTGLRQLTDARGFVEEPDGAVSTELPGPTAYSAPARF